MRSASDFYVFAKWLAAPNYAFGGRVEPGLVPEEDKDAYWRIYSELIDAADDARAHHPDAARLSLRPKQYSHDRGSRGHRPKDLWVSICADGAEVLGFMPQVYAIASERGLEIGFAASIAEDDYFDPTVKARNRSIVPFINSKLPEPGDQVTLQLDRLLAGQGGWQFNYKTRLISGQPGCDQFSSLSAMMGYLKHDGEETGGGAACRLYSPRDVQTVDLLAEFRLALDNFAPLLARCAPTPWDIQVRAAQTAVEALGDDIEFAPADEEEGRRKVLAEVARRQGQAAFRRVLLEAYDGKCAITGTDVPDVLQAAHIKPYNGPSTNKVTNGLLLRADFHSLFDLNLIAINPNSMRITVSPRLQGTIYWEFEGREINVPSKLSHRPSTQALGEHFQAAMGAEC